MRVNQRQCTVTSPCAPPTLQASHESGGAFGDSPEAILVETKNERPTMDTFFLFLLLLLLIIVIVIVIIVIVVVIVVLLLVLLLVIFVRCQMASVHLEEGRGRLRANGCKSCMRHSKSLTYAGDGPKVYLFLNIDGKHVLACLDDQFYTNKGNT